MDFYSQLRQRMIDTMQISLKQIRQVLGLGVQELSNIVGLTRQSINNLETCKIKMSTVQFVAICAVIDHFVEAQPELMQIIISILNSNDTLHDNCVYDNIESGSLLKKWFLCFPDDSKVIVAGANQIENLADNYRIFLDDTALCEMDENNQAISLLNHVKQSGKRFIIPLRAIESIQNSFLNKELSSNKARKGMINLQKLQAMGISEIRGEQSDVNIMTTLVSVFVRYKVVYRLALITQNPKLAKSILALNHDDIGGFPVLVLHFSEDGSLQKWNISNDNNLSDDNAHNNEDPPEQNHPDEDEETETNDGLSPMTGWETV